MSRAPILSDRQGFNRRWYAPMLRTVFTPTSAAEVVQAWKDAHEQGATRDTLQVTCGRHCYEAFVYNDKTQFIIDLSGLRDYGVKDNVGYYIGVGNGNWDMYRIFNNVYGRTLPAGSCYSVGLGGHITGGGYGLLSRQFGLAIDHLTAVDIVVWSGTSPELVTASATENPDLFWAVRGGGGGNFGIITHYYFDPPVAPSYFYTDALTIDWKDINADILRGLLQAFYKTSTVVVNEPDPTFFEFHCNHSAAGSMAWLTFLFDVPGEGKTGKDYECFVADRIRDTRKEVGDIVRISDEPGPVFGHPWLGDSSSLMRLSADADTFRRYTFLEGMQNVNGSGPNRFGKYKSAYMNKVFTFDMAELMYNGLIQVPNGYPPSEMAQSLVQVDSYGCAINQVASEQTAIAQRSSVMKLQYQTYWDNDADIGSDDPTQELAHLNWINNIYTTVYSAYGGFPDPRNDPTGTVDGCYYNYPDVYLGINGQPYPGIDHAMYLYFKENYASTNQPYNLVSVKTKWNPNDWFQSSQSIPIPLP